MTDDHPPGERSLSDLREHAMRSARERYAAMPDEHRAACDWTLQRARDDAAFIRDGGPRHY